MNLGPVVAELAMAENVTGFGCRPVAELATRAKAAGPAFESRQ